MLIIICVKYGCVHILHISCISTLSHILDASHRLAVVPTLSSIIASLIQGGTASYISNQIFSLFLVIWHPTPSTIIASQYYWLNLLIQGVYEGEALPFLKASPMLDLPPLCSSSLLWLTFVLILKLILFYICQRAVSSWQRVVTAEYI